MKTFWDYTEHAEFYKYRPNYEAGAIDRLVASVGARREPDYQVADVGAGTGNLTLMLDQRGLRCVAIEPNDAMRAVGAGRAYMGEVTWQIGTGENTGLPDAAVDWVTMGSSFNTMDRAAALREAHRILKPGGYFTCMWNHRDLDDPFQEDIEKLIQSYIPEYTRGTRREDQTETIAESGLFEEPQFIEGTQVVSQPAEDYANAWRSTRNLKAQGEEIFERVIMAIEDRARAQGVLKIAYTTRIWTARRRERASR